MSSSKNCQIEEGENIYRAWNLKNSDQSERTWVVIDGWWFCSFRFDTHRRFVSCCLSSSPHQVSSTKNTKPANLASSTGSGTNLFSRGAYLINSNYVFIYLKWNYFPPKPNEELWASEQHEERKRKRERDCGSIRGRIKQAPTDERTELPAGPQISIFGRN